MKYQEGDGKPSAAAISAELRATRKGQLSYDPDWSPKTASNHEVGLSPYLQISPVLLSNLQSGCNSTKHHPTSSPALGGITHYNGNDDSNSISGHLLLLRQTCVSQDDEEQSNACHLVGFQGKSTSCASQTEEHYQVANDFVSDFAIMTLLREATEKDIKKIEERVTECYTGNISARKLNFKDEISKIHESRNFDYQTIVKDTGVEAAKDILDLQDLSLHYQEQERIRSEKRRHAHASHYQACQRDLQDILSRKKKIAEEEKRIIAEERQKVEEKKRLEYLERSRKEEAEKKLLELARQLETIGEEAKKHATFIFESFKTSKFKDHLPPQSHQISELARNEFMKCITIVSEGVSGIDAAEKFEEARKSVDRIKKLAENAKIALQVAEKEGNEAIHKSKSEQVVVAPPTSLTTKTPQMNQPEVLGVQQEQKGTKSATLQDEFVMLEKPECAGVCIAATSVTEYKRIRQLLHEHQKKYDGIVTTADKNRKQIRFNMKRAINTPLNAVSDQTPRHLLDKIRRITLVLSGKESDVSGKRVNPLADPEGLDYCKGLFAHELIMQGAKQVSSSHNSAFSFAAVALGIWVQLPDVGELILANFYEKCPYLVPLYPVRIPGESSTSYFKRLGYDVEDDVVETSEKYLKKLSGIVRLYAALIQSPMPPHFSRFPHPHGLSHGWTWCARILNLPPIPTITATVLYDFLEVAGHALLKLYGEQFKKLLMVLCSDFIKLIDEVTPKDERGPVIRLRSFLEKVLQSGRIPEPAGYLSGSWWTS